MDDEPQYIPDPKAVKPDDWDNEEDGEWEPPQIGDYDIFLCSQSCVLLLCPVILFGWRVSQKIMLQEVVST